MTRPPAPHRQPPSLARVVGLRDLVLFYIVSGISLRWVSVSAAAGPGSLAVWAAAWFAFFVPLAVSVVELASRFPDQGGLYVWTKRAFGDGSGFISAWAYWTSNLPYFPAVLYFAAANALFVCGEEASAAAANRLYYMLFALAGLTLAAALHIRGLDTGKWLSNAGAFGMYLPILAVVAIAAVRWAAQGPATGFPARAFIPGARLEDMSFWASIAFALGGCEAASLMGGEIKDARRAIPRALFIGAGFVLSAYMLGVFSLMVVLPPAKIHELTGLMDAVAAGVSGGPFTFLVPLVAALITLSNLGAAGAYLGAAARLPFAAGVDRYLPPAFGRLHPKYGTPYVSILAQFLFAALFIVMSQAGATVKGAYDVLVSMGVITYFVPYLFVFAAMIKVQSMPAGPEVNRPPGGAPVAIALAATGFAVTAFAIALSFLPRPDEPNKLLAASKTIGLSALTLGSGAVLFRAARHRSGDKRESDTEP